MPERARDTSAERNRQRATLQRLAHVMDSAIPLPGGLRIGMDGIIGLIPGVGDAIGAAVSSYIVIQANSLGVSRAVLMRMFGNIIIDAALGAVPVLGDLFDFAWKANRRNIKLLEDALAEPHKARRRSALVVTALVIGVLALAVLVTVAAVALVRWVWTSVGG